MCHLEIVELERQIFSSPILLAISIHVLGLLYGAATHSASVDEVGHLAAGVADLTGSEFDLYVVNPPLTRLVAAIPVLLRNPVVDWSGNTKRLSDRSEFSVGRRFVAVNSGDIVNLWFLSRLTNVCFSILGLMCCTVLARRLIGTAANLPVCVLWTASPLILGFGSTMTPDLGGAALGIVVVIAAYIWFRSPMIGTSILLDDRCCIDRDGRECCVRISELEKPRGN